MLRLLSDDGLSLPGRGPFRDVAGGFVASAEIRDRRCSVYVPFGAVRYASPKNISLEVAVVAAHATGHEPVGKAVLDASLPAPGVWRLADYLEPLIALGGRMMTPEQSVDEAALAQMVERLAEALGFDRDEWPGGALEAMVAHARDPLALKEAIHGARFRFPGLGRTELQALLRHATVTDEETDVSDEWRALLEAALAELD
jgi:hypothetical protein